MADRTLLVTKNSGEQFRITIPSDAKITFGYFNPTGGPGDNRARYSDESREDMKRSCLRIYRGSKDNGEQLAAFTGVREFRDLGLSVERLVKKSVGQASWEEDTEGNLQESRKVVVSKRLAKDDDLLELEAGDEEDD